MPSFTFIDLFAGIGGIRIAFEAAGGECVFSAEYDKFAQDTYDAFFKERPDFVEVQITDPPGNIKQLPPSLVPDHDILTAGFPCQPFSLAGVSKKNSLGRVHGILDRTQGTLFEDIAKILDAKKPKAFLLENVKHLRNHNKGDTYDVIRGVLEAQKYEVFDRVIDAAGWVPQHRERIYLVGFRKPEAGVPQDWDIQSFNELDQIRKRGKKHLALSAILETQVPDNYILGDGTWHTLERHKEYHAGKNHGFGFGLNEADSKKPSRTLSARYHKDGAEILIKRDDPDNPNPRRLTPFECAKLMGYPKKYLKYFNRNSRFKQPVSDTQAYRQFGNSVVVPLVTQIARTMIKKMQEVGALREPEI